MDEIQLITSKKVVRRRRWDQDSSVGYNAARGLKGMGTEELQSS